MLEECTILTAASFVIIMIEKRKIRKVENASGHIDLGFPLDVFRFMMNCIIGDKF